ncbi:MAG: hypothetical protein QM709_02925 [Spongiibacteraceae bacterium]
MSKTYTLDELKKLKSKTDIERFKQTSEKEIMEQSIADPDTPYLTDDEIKELHPPVKKENGK